MPALNTSRLGGVMVNPYGSNLVVVVGAYHIAEFSFDLVSLEQTSWGAIKSSF